MQDMGKDLHKVFKAFVNDILQTLPILGESGSEVSYFITYPRNFAEVTRISENINKPWIKDCDGEPLTWGLRKDRVRLGMVTEG